ncbi:hypothetical protein FD754_012999 [Muntiacus muntjak]|uniref:GDNF/GAS1 domain-containing protein n=1 Tax=Muntiacus muntjak TaxID=9888 RepID=A0A5N3VG81_MUNMU|nr:hypothetical protein FD754_012999 [Muntiacus muntjak]
MFSVVTVQFTVPPCAQGFSFLHHLTSTYYLFAHSLDVILCFNMYWFEFDRPTLRRSLVGYSPWGHKESKSRLADFFTNCQPESRSVSSCLKENYADCLLAYSGLIGTVMTPNYIDSSSLSVAPWCDCNNSGNDLEECLKFLNFFKDNTCLKNAIQAFGNGSDVTVWQPALPVQTTTATTTTAFRVKNKPLGPAGSENEIPTHVLPPCANLQRDYEKDGLAGASSHITTKSMAAPPSCGLSPLLALLVVLS